VALVHIETYPFGKKCRLLRRSAMTGKSWNYWHWWYPEYVSTMYLFRAFTIYVHSLTTLQVNGLAHYRHVSKYIIPCRFYLLSLRPSIRFRHTVPIGVDYGVHLISIWYHNR
jgi:hypothetical protein